ncbi:hypothetical protein P43SY_009722 [Pythium insidiosum]|uniref:Uncharacterized protein n=1 Tax=Pythium insidiosum TaxID=114742 RepID=A0AAD5LLG1_PYTIN|nr:hypothetical protein P43SY_009722 [Pythium insidiosum]
MALELLFLGDRLHERGAPPECTEKVIGILTRLAVNEAIATRLSKEGAHVILQLLSLVDDERYLELALFGLLSQLAFVWSIVPILVASDAIAISLERLCINLHDDELLQSNLSLLHAMLLASDCSSAYVDPKMTLMMRLIVDEVSRSSRVRQLAQALLDDLPLQKQHAKQVLPKEATQQNDDLYPVAPLESREPEQVQTAPVLPHQSENAHVVSHQMLLRQVAERPALDYHRRKEQRKIWQENKALAKRLRNTKPTLNAKEWEKDDKWNQQFLKTHERRRQALQQELTKTLSSPHAALVRSKAITAPKEPDSVVGGVSDDHAQRSVRDFRRRRSSNDVVSSEEQRRLNSAANHRRIMQLRQQKTASELYQQGSASEAPGPPDELVEVRFTFSRRRGRLADLATPNGISGQFSPAFELERTLENMMDDQLVPSVVLQEPLTSRLGMDDRDIGRVVFEVLQTCIDVVASQEDLKEESVLIGKDGEEEQCLDAVEEGADLSSLLEPGIEKALDVTIHWQQQPTPPPIPDDPEPALINDGLTMVDGVATGGDDGDELEANAAQAGDVDAAADDNEFDEDDFEPPSPTPRPPANDVNDADIANETELYEDDLESDDAENADDEDPYSGDGFSD